MLILDDQYFIYEALDGIVPIVIVHYNLKCLFQPVDAEPAELKEVKGEFDHKSPSQRLRGVLFVMFKQKSVPGEFEDFYRKEMETVINRYKKELEPE